MMPMRQRILVVDDDPSLAEMLTIVLRNEGFETAVIADGSKALTAAKARCGDAARLAVNEAVQMHGGIGMTDEYDIGFFMKRAAAARQEYGDSYYHANRFAAIRGY